MDTRQAVIENAEANTCGWLFQGSRYQDWLDSQQLKRSRGLLWIKGKPGSGKPTLMKLAFEHPKEVSKYSSLETFLQRTGRGDCSVCSGSIQGSYTSAPD